MKKFLRLMCILDTVLFLLTLFAADKMDEVQLKKKLKEAYFAALLADVWSLFWFSKYAKLKSLTK